MNIRFDQSAMTDFINESVNAVWNGKVQDNSYKQLVLELKQIGVDLTPEQEKAFKICFNHVGIISTKQSLIAMLHFMDKVGIIKYGD